jgi:hypothetical protein
MKRLFLSGLAVMIILTAAVQAQEVASTTRIEAQHKPLGSMGKNLAAYEENVLKTLANENPTMQAQALQTLRDLEQMFPKYPFSACLTPLESKLKDEKTDPIVRRLSALALDELHSDAGDAVIAGVAKASDDKGLQLLCSALMVRSQYK